MKEQLYTIPLNDAVNANDECPFCYIERDVEQDLLDYVLGSGSSYMEADMRDKTDRAGFCRAHFKKMFDYGNTLGNGWILKTHYMRMTREFEQEMKSFRPGKKKLFEKLKGNAETTNTLSLWLTDKEKSCYICRQFEDTYERYLDTFFYLWDKDSDFRGKIINGKGFCLPHFRDLIDGADNRLSNNELEEFYRTLLPVMDKSLHRLTDDVSWLVEKFDYRNQDADWKTSKDAIQRGMQKLKGGYPSDPAYRSKK